MPVVATVVLALLFSWVVCDKITDTVELLLDVVLDEEPEDIVWEVLDVTLELVTDDCVELVTFEILLMAVFVKLASGVDKTGFIIEV